MLSPFKSQLIADTGISTGDEGKGRLILEIAHELREATGREDCVAAVLKVNGGSNSGHTVAGLKLNLLPGGVPDASVSFLPVGSGVVADPRKFIWEMTYAEDAGCPVMERLVIDERCQVSDLTHRLLDLAWEDYRTHVQRDEPRGSTGRGITPAYLDEVGQFQIHYSEFRGSKEVFAARLRARADRALRVIEHVCRVAPERWPGLFETLSTAEARAHRDLIDRKVLPASEFDFGRFMAPGGEPFRLDLDLLVETYWEAGQRLAARIADVRELVLRALDEGRYVIGEFGQAYWLDKRHGFPPNVTASHTFTPEFFQSAGIPAQPVHTLGCCKAYDTKVGTHVFISEIEHAHALAKKLRQLEFGATTGRQRMVGWFDAVEKGDALRYGGYDDLVLNKLDALSHSGDWTGELLVCVAYEDPGGNRIRHVPRDDAYRRTLRPVFQALPGWREDLSQVRTFLELPEEARRYVAWLLRSVIEVANHGDQSATRRPNLRYIGVGPDPSQIIRDIPETGELLKLAT